MEDIRVNTFMSSSQRTINQVPLRVWVDIIRFNLFCFHQPVYQGMIFCQRCKSTIAVEIGATISYIGNECQVALNKGGRHSTSQSAGRRLLFSVVQYGFVCLTNSSFELVLDIFRNGCLWQPSCFTLFCSLLGHLCRIQFNGLLLRQRSEFDGLLLSYRHKKTFKSFANLLYGKFTRHFTCLISTHPISNYKESSILIFRDKHKWAIFVLFALFPHISFISASKCYWHWFYSSQ